MAGWMKKAKSSKIKWVPKTYDEMLYWLSSVGDEYDKTLATMKKMKAKKGSTTAAATRRKKAAAKAKKKKKFDTREKVLKNDARRRFQNIQY